MRIQSQDVYVFLHTEWTLYPRNSFQCPQCWSLPCLQWQINRYENISHLGEVMKRRFEIFSGSMPSKPLAAILTPFVTTQFHTQVTLEQHSFTPVWPWNLTDDLEKSRTPLLYWFKLCASFQSHQWIQTGVRVRKPSIRFKIGDFCPMWSWNLMDNLEKL